MLGGLFGTIVSGFFGGGLTTITNAITSLQKQKLDAANDEQRMELDRQIANLQARRDVMIAEAQAGSKLNAIIRAAFAVPVAYYYGKIFLYDKALGLGVTDPLSDDLTWTARVIIGFYFLFEATRAIRR